jgi:hypothetical protein
MLIVASILELSWRSVAVSINTIHFSSIDFGVEPLDVDRKIIYTILYMHEHAFIIDSRLN